MTCREGKSEIIKNLTFAKTKSKMLLLKEEGSISMSGGGLRFY